MPPQIKLYTLRKLKSEQEINKSQNKQHLKLLTSSEAT
jgi:hypothetical protein